jgi:hypothetical protein
MAGRRVLASRMISPNSMWMDPFLDYPSVPGVQASSGSENAVTHGTDKFATPKNN